MAHCQKGKGIGGKKILGYPKVFLITVVTMIGCLHINKMRKIDFLSLLKRQSCFSDPDYSYFTSTMCCKKETARLKNLDSP